MKRNKFNLSYTKLLSCNMGSLIPVGLTEVLPGDTFQHSTSFLIRCAPLLAPVMHPVIVRSHHFFVPHRLIWEDWEDFITAGNDGMDDSVPPTINFGSIVMGQLPDYYGLPTGSDLPPVSALPFRGYSMIWNEFFRDQDLQAELVVSEASGDDTTTNTTLQNINWEKDYYTSSRPWEQKGPAITIPLGTQAPVSGLGVADALGPAVGGAGYKDATGLGLNYPGVYNSNANTFSMRTKGASSTSQPDVYADLSNASAVTINLLREAFALQRFQEARARFGSRYVEYLRYLGVQSSDARLQRPEYLGGGRQTIQFSEVLQTAEGDSPVGEMRGHGIGAMRSNRYRRFFEEHGYIHSFISVRPKTIYMQGIHRHWSRATKEDFWQVELQHIGQQEVLRKEVYAAAADPNAVFGFQDRYDEYRRNESSVAGEFRGTQLDYWHLGRNFATEPALNSDFVSCVPTERVFADQSQDVLYVMAKHHMIARRKLAASGSSFIL